MTTESTHKRPRELGWLGYLFVLGCYSAGLGIHLVGAGEFQSGWLEGIGLGVVVSGIFRRAV